MPPTLRAVFHILLVSCGLALSGGCSEYNRYPTVSEEATLSSVVQLTDGFDRAGEPIVSHDLRWMVFRAVAPGQPQPQMFLAKLLWKNSDIVGTERPICITPAGSRSSSGSFSPDGLSLIFASNAATATRSLTSEKYPNDQRIFRVDGWEGAISMTDAATGTNLAKHPLGETNAYTAECSYSPDGKWICFTSTRNANANLYVMHADGSHIVQLTNTPAYDGEASFSPDGKSLVFRSDRNPDHLMQIYIGDLTFDSDGEIAGITNEKALTHEDNICTNPCWNPDGKHIVYATSKQGHSNYELYMMDRAGRRKTRITFFPGADLLPTFSPDGRYLLWTSKRTKDGSTQVFLAGFTFPRGS